MAIKRNTRFIGGLAVALLLPLSFYFIAKLLSKDKIELPGHYVVDRVDTIVEDGDTYADTVYHKVADVSLTNQLGKEVSINGDLKDNIVVINFFFSTCPTICPKLTGNMTMLQKAFKKNDTTVHFVSISVDPETDTFQALRSYSEQYNVDHDHWWFLTGDRSKIYNYATNELHVVMGENGQGADQFIHTQKLVLLDKKRHIRGYYDGLDTAELRRCADDIILLTMEKDRKRRTKIN